MPSDNHQLKTLASEQFTKELFEAIAYQIDNDAQKSEAPITVTARNPEEESMVSRSAATLFLADRFYFNQSVGHFNSRPLVSWNGMDEFIFVPDENNVFSYTTSSGRIIKPQQMETDGGSVPRILRGLKKFSSWGYAPAFIIHDWLFTAKKCNHHPDTNWTFSDSALVMAEAMKTLMEKGFQDYDGKTVKLDKAEDTLYLMYLAVKSSIAENLWNNVNSVGCIPRQQ